MTTKIEIKLNAVRLTELENEVFLQRQELEKIKQDIMIVRTQLTFVKDAW